MRSWDRASFEFHTMPTRRRRPITRRDLLLPAYHSRLRLLGACAVCGACISLLYVWTTLMVITIATDHELGPWIWLVVLAAAVVTTIVFYAFASRQMARYREYAADL